MKRNSVLILVFLVVLGALAAGCTRLSRALNNGGTIFLVELVEGDNVDADRIARSVQVIQSRLNAIGVDGEVIRSDSGENHLEVKLYGKNDLQRLRDFLFTTYKLECRKVVSQPNPSPAQTFPSEDDANAALSSGQEVLPYTEVEGMGSPRFVIVEKETVITGEDVRSADAISRSGSDLDYQISFSLKREGAERFGDWTAKNINNYLAVVLDGKVESIAFIRSQISDAGEISGRFSKEHAKDIALSLKSGYMPWKLRIVEEKSF